MQQLINAMMKSCDDANWYGALFLAMTLPDICGKCEGLPQNPKRYIEWFDKYLAPVYTTDFPQPGTVFLSGGDCYAFRCALLHEASDNITTQRLKETLKQFRFTTLGIHRLIGNDEVLVLDVKKFCEEMKGAVAVWQETTKGLPEVQQRISELITIREQGFSPIPGVRIG